MGAFYELSYRGFTTYRVARNVRDHPCDGSLRLEIPRYDAVRGLAKDPAVSDRTAVS